VIAQTEAFGVSLMALSDTPDRYIFCIPANCLPL